MTFSLIDYFKRPPHMTPSIPDSEYEACLSTFLTQRPQKEVHFFINPKRFYLMSHMMGDIVSTRIKTILNVACGPFAFENYMALPSHAIESFDCDEKLLPLFEAFKAKGYCANVAFRSDSLESFCTYKKYDFVLINDLFYLKYVDFYENITKYANFVNSNGYIYFDLLDRRAGFLWSLFGKDSHYKRYDMKEVEAFMAKMNFERIRTMPSIGIKGGLDRWVRKTLYKTFSLANNHAYLYQKNM
jgi:hypothetical protein